MDLGFFIDRGNHEPARPVYLAILAVKCALLAVRCSVHERKWPARPTDRTAGGRPDRLVASDRDPCGDRRLSMIRANSDYRLQGSGTLAENRWQER
jgi:hypothetical protein